VFESRQQARAFAQRHAQALLPDALPLKWDDAAEPEVLSTVLGDYRITRITTDPRPQPPTRTPRALRAFGGPRNAPSSA
jgi:hypothetical protein